MKRTGGLAHLKTPKTKKTPALFLPLILAVLALGLAIPAYRALPAKLVPDSSPTWERTYGGAKFESATSVKPVPGGGFIVSGFRPAQGHSNLAAWVMRLDERGDVIWEGSYGERTSAASIATTRGEPPLQ